MRSTARALLVVPALLSSWACGSATRSEPSEPRAKAPGASASPTSTHAAPATPTSLATASSVGSMPRPEPPGPSAAAPLSPPPPRLPKVATSPGKIECGTVECELATEACCIRGVGSPGRCLPRGDQDGCTEVFWSACDESADCAKAEACCYTPRTDPGVRFATNDCQKRCEDPAFETCLAGGTCKNGKPCKLSDPDAYTGYCL